MTNSPTLGANKEIRQIVLAAVDQGWTVRRTKKCHLILTSPTGERVVTGTSTGRSGATRLADLLRKRGVSI